MKFHFDPLSGSGGRPHPHVESVAVQSMRLNQSPESYELRSSDFDRSRSVPACQNDGLWPSAVVARAIVFIRTRSAIGVSAGSLYWRTSKSVSLSWASTYVIVSDGSAA